MLLNQTPHLPLKKLPIVAIGAGGIMRNAHLPAYKMCDFYVTAIFDARTEAAKELAHEFEIATVLSSLDELPGYPCIFDLAIPASGIAEVLKKLPDGAFVLIQKPMGETLDQAKEIVQICETKNLRAAVNFQLRWAPYTLVLKDLIAQGLLGEVHDVDFKINVHTPWELWDFLEKAPRMEMIYHSIHYLDLVRDLLGEPNSVMAKSIKHRNSPKLESSRSAIILDYGDWKRATIHTNHGYMAGPRHQESYLKVEGSKGVAKFQMGLNMDYPTGGPDYFEYWQEGTPDWVSVPLEGGWFPHAFRGPMAAMMLWAEGGEPPSTEIHDAYKTMALVEAAYCSSDQGGIDPSLI